MAKTIEPIQENGEKSLPKGWRRVRLGDVSNISTGTTPATNRSDYYRGHIPFVKTSEVVNNRITKSEAFVSQKASDDYGLKLYPPGTVLMAMYGQGKTRGQVAILDIAAATTQNAAAIVPSNAVVSDYIWYWLRGKYEYLRQLGYQGDISHLSLSYVKQLEIPLPPIAEQKRIVAILNEQMATVEKARAATLAQLEAAKALPAAYLRQIFDSPEAQKWERRKLGEFSLVSGGLQKVPGRSPSCFHRPYLTVRNVQRGWLDLTAVERFELTSSELERCRLEYGDLLIVEGNGSVSHIGRNAIYRGEIENCVHQNHLIRVRLNQATDNPEFFSFYLNSDFGKLLMLEKAKTTTGLYTLSVSKIQQLEVPVVQLKTQNQITSKVKDKLTSTTELQHSLQDQLKAINKLPAALLRQAFNGEL